jgi:beta-phosphoglucomutase-like phosphatase (HAD superfamily)
LAAELLGVPVGRCVVIEDSPTGVASAVAAGAAVMAVRGVVAIDPAVGVPVVETLDGVDLAFLADLVG